MIQKHLVPDIPLTKKKQKTSQGESVANHICTSNKIFGRAIWNKLPMYIFENRPNQTCGY